MARKTAEIINLEEVLKREYRNVIGRVELITPEKAHEMLIGRNRILRKMHIAYLARNMIKDRWKVNGESIKITVRGKLIDGQHRLLAVVMSGVSIFVMVIRGLPEDAFETLGRGMSRTHGDTLFCKGEDNWNTLGQACVIVAQRSLGNLTCNLKITTPEVETVLDENPNIRVSATVCDSSGLLKRVIPASVGAFCYYYATKDNASLADEFFTQLELGAELERTDPVYLLREAMYSAKMTPGKNMKRSTKLALVTKAWNATFKGQKLKNLRWIRSEPMPRFNSEPAANVEIEALDLNSIADFIKAQAASSLDTRKESRKSVALKDGD